jgi:hypothetical protein
MLDKADKESPAIDTPDRDRVYRSYVEDCRRLGIEPVSPDRAQDLMEEWSEALAGPRLVPPNTH